MSLWTLLVDGQHFPVTVHDDTPPPLHVPMAGGGGYWQPPADLGGWRCVVDTLHLPLLTSGPYVLTGAGHTWQFTPLRLTNRGWAGAAARC